MGLRKSQESIVVTLHLFVGYGAGLLTRLVRANTRAVRTAQVASFAGMTSFGRFSYARGVVAGTTWARPFDA